MHFVSPKAGITQVEEVWANLYLPPPPLHDKKGGVVRGECRWISSQNRRNGRMSLEFFVEELPDQLPGPSFRMIEIRVKGKVSLVKDFCFHLLGFCSINWHIEYGKI